MARLSDYGLTNGGLGGIQSQAPGAPGAPGVAPTALVTPTGARGPAGPQGPGPVAPPPFSLNPNDPGYVAPVQPRRPGGPSMADLAAGMAYGAAHTPPPIPDYASLYESGLSQARGGIEQQFSMAMKDIAAREGLANKTVGLLPGQLNQIYTDSQGQLVNGIQALDAGQKNAGVHSFTTAGQQMAPLVGAIRSNKASDESTVPMMQLAVQTQMAQERGGLNQAHLGALADLASQEASARVAAAQQTYNAQAQQYSGRVGAEADAAKTAHDDNMKLTLAQIGQGQHYDSKLGMTTSEADNIRNSQPYKNFAARIQMIQSGLPSSDLFDATMPTRDDVTKLFGSNPQLLKIIAADFAPVIPK